MKTLDEWAFWCACAMWFETVSAIPPWGLSGDWRHYNYWPGGICYEFGHLAAFVNPTSMEDRVVRYWPKSEDIRGYRWPLTPAGHRARARFCWRMAAMCESEENR